MNVYEIATKLLDEPVYIATLMGNSLVTNKLYKSYKLKIRFFEFNVDLIVLGIDNFDANLEMD